MKKDTQPNEPSEEDMAMPAPDEVRDDVGARQGRSGEGAHSAMKHWLHEERNRIKRPEH